MENLGHFVTLIHTISNKSSWKEYLPLLTHSISCLQDYKNNSLRGQGLNVMTEGQDPEVKANRKVFTLKFRVSSDVGDVLQSGCVFLIVQIVFLC